MNKSEILQHYCESMMKCGCARASDPQLSDCPCIERLKHEQRIDQLIDGAPDSGNTTTDLATMQIRYDGIKQWKEQARK